MKILVSCEESGKVRSRLRAMGHDAWSCDVEPARDNSPYHLQQDVRPLLKRPWDMLIAFPPCTDLAVSGAAWFAQKRKDGRQKKAIDFFMLHINANSPRIMVENPVGIMSTIYRKPDQIINPYEFGHLEQKKTCLWLKGLPLLRQTRNVKAQMLRLPINKRQRLYFLPPSANRARDRSETFDWIADAIAQQYGGIKP